MNPSTSHQTIPSAPNSSIIWDDYDRQSLFQSWLKTAGSNHHLSDNTLRSASADASFRRYFRIDNSLAVIIPLSALGETHEDTVFLNLDKQQIESLPAFPVSRRWS